MGYKSPDFELVTRSPVHFYLELFLIIVYILYGTEDATILFGMTKASASPKPRPGGSDNRVTDRVTLTVVIVILNTIDVPVE